MKNKVSGSARPCKDLLLFEVKLKVNCSCGQALPLPNPPQASKQITPIKLSRSSLYLPFCSMKTNMADSTWKEDDNLKEAMTKLVQQGLQRIEALDFLKRDFPQYPWSTRTLDR